MSGPKTIGIALLDHPDKEPAMLKHFHNGRTYASYGATGPGTILVDETARVEGSTGPALLLRGDGWDVTVDGTLTSAGADAVSLTDMGKHASEIVIGADGSVQGFGAGNGVRMAHATTIVNNGLISSSEETGIYATAVGDFSIANGKGGVIEGGDQGIALFGGGIHVIRNAGIVTGDPFFGYAILGSDGVEMLTNSGKLVGNVSLGGGDDVFANFAKVNGVVKIGTMNYFIDLGAGNDRFLGGANGEVVIDGDGRDKVSLGGGGDRFIGLLSGEDDRTDTIDGGSGTDTYDASKSGAVGVRVNLDTVDHLDLFASFAGDFTAYQPGDIVKNFENAIGTAGRDVLVGTDGANQLTGREDDDVLLGLKGADQFYGGDGRDAFVFASLADSGPGRAARDTVFDFKPGIDGIDMSYLNLEVGGTLHFLGMDKDFTGQAGEIRGLSRGDDTLLQIDADGDLKADFAVTFYYQQGITAGDFFL